MENKNNYKKTENRAENRTENLSDSIWIWNHAGISLVDIRHKLLAQGETLKEYRLPANAYIFTSGGSTEVSLNNVVYHVERFGMYHGGKGTELSIYPLCDWIEYYMVLYRVGEPAFYKRQLVKLLEKTNPFNRQFGYAPQNPIFFSEVLRTMYECWSANNQLENFYGKVGLYQIVYEVHKELAEKEVEIFRPDVIAMAKQYMDKHYGEPISIQTICSLFNVSRSYFHKSFTAYTGKSPQSYLIERRLTVVKKYLDETNFTLKEIAKVSGFSDEFVLMRRFGKYFKMTTSEYKDISTYERVHSTMENVMPFPYNEEGLVRLAKLKSEGAYFMFKHLKGTSVITAVLLAAMLLTGCAANTSVTNNTANTSNQSVETQLPETNTIEVEKGTKIINTVNGEVEIPVNPQRVIVHYLMGDIYALGITPVGVSEVHNGAVFEGETKEAVNLGSWDFEPEAVMALEPDLIISVNEGQYEELSKIAPTVLVPYGSMSTEERLTFLGEILNKQDEAEVILKDYEEKIETGRKKLEEAEVNNISVTILQVTGENNSVAGAKHALGILAYNELGLSAPEKVQKEIIDLDEYWAQPSMEVLSEFCGDYMIHLGEVPEAVKSNTVWASIPAVKENKIIIAETALTYYTDILSSGTLIDTLVDDLIRLSE